MANHKSPTILFIDAYDSFSNNIRCILEEDLDVQVVEVKIDTIINSFDEWIQSFDAVVIGPGPGHPANSSDVGLINEIWQLAASAVLPVFGICLGFQSLVLAHGGSVTELPNPRHGIVRTVRTSDDELFQRRTIQAVQYHSLHASLSDVQGKSDDPVPGDQSSLWSPTSQCPDLIPLAWDCSSDNVDDEASSHFSANPEAILMAVKHRTKPFYGVQFHPESICSDRHALGVLHAWWKQAQMWNDAKRTLFLGPNSRQPRIHLPISPHSNCQKANSADVVPDAIPHRQVLFEALDFPLTLKVPQICASLNLPFSNCIVLDSEPHLSRELGRYSIIGIVDDSTPILSYYLADGHFTLSSTAKGIIAKPDQNSHNIFGFLKDFMESNKATGGDVKIPFWGGFMGFISYELGLTTIGIAPTTSSQDTQKRPDLSFAFVERSVVLNHEYQQAYVQSIRVNDLPWVQRTVLDLQSLSGPMHLLKDVHKSSTRIEMPCESTYHDAIKKCQLAIGHGDSYELCLTSRATIRISDRRLASWPLYLRLREINPAPFSAYVRLGRLTLLSSSPERFLCWSRSKTNKTDPSTAISVCQFRPIKGTVKKQAHEGAPFVNFEEGCKILSTPKEKAENLMIVDLIRHDLHGVAGPGNVRVSKLMSVEEYATLYQLVTVIEGDLISPATSETDELAADDHGEKGARQNGCDRSLNANARIRKAQDKTGIDVLAASLPPGSMTGAPKKRSCQLLQSIEQQKPRGVYSGVVGYMDVGGGGDFSVVIRSAVRWDDEQHETDGDEWTIGAGGAVTSLSTEEGEWQEMLAKLKSTLRLFEGGA